MKFFNKNNYFSLTSTILPFSLKLVQSQATLGTQNEAFISTMNQINSDITPQFRKFTSIIDLVWHKLENHENFDISEFITDEKKNVKKNLAAMIEDYGCHCFPNRKSLIGGKGVPKDALDNACRALSRCHKCVEMDYLDENTFEPVCNTDTDGYKFTLADSRNIVCEDSARHHICQTKQCECDKAFAETVFELFTGSDDDWTFNPDFWLNNRYVKELENLNLAPFDFESSCVISGDNPNKNADSCCGVYPVRRPYASDKKQCCNGLIIHPLFKECCENGESMDLGSGCS